MASYRVTTKKNIPAISGNDFNHVMTGGAVNKASKSPIPGDIEPEQDVAFEKIVLVIHAVFLVDDAVGRAEK